MNDFITYTIYSPPCDACGREAEERGYVNFRIELRYLLDAAGFEDWPIWKELTTKQVATAFKKLRTILNEDAIKFAHIQPPDGRRDYGHTGGWSNYSSLMQSIEGLIIYCETNPKGTVKTRTR